MDIENVSCRMTADPHLLVWGVHHPACLHRYGLESGVRHMLLARPVRKDSAGTCIVQTQQKHVRQGGSKGIHYRGD